jgi:hypothetical protein
MSDMIHCLTAVATVTDVSQTDAQSQLHSFFQSYDPTLRQEETEIQVQGLGGTSPTGDDTPTHLFGRYRFPDGTTDKDTVLGALTASLRDHPDVDTFEVAYHVCDHGQPPTERGACDPVTAAVSDPAPPDGVEP